ncbi:MAG: hypothetical protein DHS20C18_20110 [Saprospiraceae bacterium]|nr:MAG: hypothetical protein DHS20C18_20110 [Saprospiraceae bacterium]
MLFFCGAVQAQKAIQLNNPSFEDTPRAGHVPTGWKNCGQEFESPPDTHPADAFGVNIPAIDGNTYLGLVVRDNDTWEQVGQRLSTALSKGQCYTFSLYLARSQSYHSASRITYKDANYNTPAVIRIWGGNANCEKLELLALSVPVVASYWREYQFKFSPKRDHYSHLVIEAYYKDRFGEAYNGNILVDKASDIVPVDCDTPDK